MTTPILSFCFDPLIRTCAWLFACREAFWNGEPVHIRAVSPKSFESVQEQQTLL